MIRVGPLREGDLDEVLPLFAAYQRFYEVERPDDTRNRTFLSRFLEPSDHGLALGAWDGDHLVGFATLYWTFSSTRAADVALMNDLYVVEGHRGAGTGFALIEASCEAARRRGLSALEWYTAVDNRRAQRLYERVPGAVRDAWFGYEVDLSPSGGGSEGGGAG